MVVGLGEERNKMSLGHRVLPGNKEGLKVHNNESMSKGHRDQVKEPPMANDGTI